MRVRRRQVRGGNVQLMRSRLRHLPELRAFGVHGRRGARPSHVPGFVRFGRVRAEAGLLCAEQQQPCVERGM